MKRNLRLEKLEKENTPAVNPPPEIVYFTDGICDDGTGRTPEHKDFEDYPNGDIKYVCVDYV